MDHSLCVWISAVNTCNCSLEQNRFFHPHIVFHVIYIYRLIHVGRQHHTLPGPKAENAPFYFIANIVEIDLDPMFHKIARSLFSVFFQDLSSIFKAKALPFRRCILSSRIGRPIAQEQTQIQVISILTAFAKYLTGVLY